MDGVCLDMTTTTNAFCGVSGGALLRPRIGCDDGETEMTDIAGYRRGGKFGLPGAGGERYGNTGRLADNVRIAEQASANKTPGSCTCLR